LRGPPEQGLFDEQAQQVLDGQVRLLHMLGSSRGAMATSASLTSRPPAPVRATLLRPRLRASSTARMTLAELPLVLMPSRTSPARPSAWT
jgi:hypothetical protein